MLLVGINIHLCGTSILPQMVKFVNTFKEIFWINYKHNKSGSTSRFYC